MAQSPTREATIAQFDKDLLDLHLVYDYDARNPESGAAEKWRYEMWFFSHNRIVYAIHGGPMAGARITRRRRTSAYGRGSCGSVIGWRRRARYARWCMTSNATRLQRAWDLVSGIGRTRSRRTATRGIRQTFNVGENWPSKGTRRIDMC